MKVLVISGSPKQESRSRGVTDAAIKFLQNNGAAVNSFDVGMDILPLFTGKESEKENPAVQRLTALADQADGFFICTPEYHNGMSGALKNALDFLGRNQFVGKPVSIAAASGGGKGGINALNNLRLVMRGVSAFVLPDQYIADPQDFNDSCELASELSLKRIKDLVDELLLAISRMK